MSNFVSLEHKIIKALQKMLYIYNLCTQLFIDISQRLNGLIKNLSSQVLMLWQKNAWWYNAPTMDEVGAIIV